MLTIANTVLILFAALGIVVGAGLTLACAVMLTLVRPKERPALTMVAGFGLFVFAAGAACMVKLLA